MGERGQAAAAARAELAARLAPRRIRVKVSRPPPPVDRARLALDSHSTFDGCAGVWTGKQLESLVSVLMRGLDSHAGGQCALRR